LRSLISYIYWYCGDDLLISQKIGFQFVFVVEFRYIARGNCHSCLEDLGQSEYLYQTKLRIIFVNSRRRFWTFVDFPFLRLLELLPAYSF